jgi:tRNA (mo5U34)-methyltransferase
MNQEERPSPALVEYVGKVNAAGGTYHHMDFGQGVILRGHYDMRRFVQHYDIPADLNGQRVLDIGTSSGYFAFECARRGADVVAIDIWEETAVGSIAPLLGLPIRYVRRSIYDLDSDFGQFDLVICGSLLLHLPEPFGAIQRIRNVCRGRATVSTACVADSRTNPEPVCCFTGIKASDGDYWAYWLLGQEAMRRMFLAAGFSRIGHVDHFLLETSPGWRRHATDQVVMTAYV